MTARPCLCWNTPGDNDDCWRHGSVSAPTGRLLASTPIQAPVHKQIFEEGTCAEACDQQADSKLPVPNAIVRDQGCTCQWEAGDLAGCPVHDQRELDRLAAEGREARRGLEARIAPMLRGEDAYARGQADAAEAIAAWLEVEAQKLDARADTMVDDERYTRASELRGVAEVYRQRAADIRAGKWRR